MKSPCCYYCYWWDGSNASNVRSTSIPYAFCKNPEKERPDTGYEICPAISSDYCTLFVPVEGWTGEWKRIMIGFREV